MNPVMELMRIQMYNIILLTQANMQEQAYFVSGKIQAIGGQCGCLPVQTTKGPRLQLSLRAAFYHPIALLGLEASRLRLLLLKVLKPI